MKLNNKKILLGITGSIATYKIPNLVRELQKKGADVKIVATAASLEFASKLVLSNLTHSEVISEIFADGLQQRGAWHIELANWCDLMLVAPCSATTLSKIATGNADNPVSCLALALPPQKPLIIAPAMDSVMYENMATQTNINILKNRNAKFIEPETGLLASGLTGKGRLPDNDVIISYVENVFDRSFNFNVLITAGGTREKIDDVRFISNFSTGKMGYAIAEITTSMGANVCLISANVNLNPPNVNKIIEVENANEMFETIKENYENQDIIIMAAAVSDYSPENYLAGKIKKNDNDLIIKLKRTEDILKWLGENRKDKNKIIVGFALESNNEIEFAKNKLADKKCDLLVLNSVYGDKSGFGSDFNTITILDKDGNITHYDPMLKIDCAKILINIIKEKINKQYKGQNNSTKIKSIIMAIMMSLMLVSCRTGYSENESQNSSELNATGQHITEQQAIQQIVDSIVKEFGIDAPDITVKNFDTDRDVEEYLKQLMYVYPNPTSSSVSVEFRFDDLRSISLEIYYMDKKINTFDFTNIQNNRVTISSDYLIEEGTYTLVILNREPSISASFVVKKK